MLAESDSLVRPLPGLLDELCEADRRRLRGIGRDKPLETGQFVWQQGDGQTGIYLIRSGRIRSYYVAPSGREVTLAYWFPGNFVGGPDLFGTGPHMWTSVAVEASELTFLPGPALEKVALESATTRGGAAGCAGVQGAVLFGDGADAGDALGHRAAASPADLPVRIHGIRNGRETTIAVPFTHGDLANLIGSTRQWVTVQLARMQQRGIIRYHRGLIST